MHHTQDQLAFPWQWTWKDASTKQKIKKTVASDGSIEQEEFDWLEGLTHYVALGFNDSTKMENGKNNSGGCGTSEMGVLCGIENGNGNGLLGLGLGFEYEGDERVENFVKDDRKGWFRMIEKGLIRKKKRFLRFGDGGKGPGQVVCNRFWV
ncbi:hypothetical protein AMTRI_Chr02g216300 [Amborella trichopoda]